MTDPSAFVNAISPSSATRIILCFFRLDLVIAIFDAIVKFLQFACEPVHHMGYPGGIMRKNEKRQTVRLRDVAQTAGVSVGTVSRVLNNNPTVSEEVRRKVEAVMKALGYEANIVAQSLRGSTTKLIACAIRDFDIPQFAQYIKEAEQVFRERGYTFILSATTNKPEVEVSLLKAFERRKVDGIMMTVSDEANASVNEALMRAPCPVLLIDRDHIKTLDRVTVDHLNGTRTAISHLIERGHRHIALLVGDTRAFPSYSRVAGFREAYQIHGVDPAMGTIRDRVIEQEDAFRETMALFSSSVPPTAIVAASMGALPGCLKALRALRREVGKEVSVVAGNDSDLAELYTPPITALKSDLAELARHASAMLLDRIEGKASGIGRVVTLPTTLVIRQSCWPVQDAED
ncbi:LacI family DNA-binding transcriptional regulator [Agrobacterium vitis]|uniref:LacI family DNA-binding transcriptional regulator n=2 Tax=Agrobacterium vitis TaxID=373 RepID=UPI001F16BE15|nr:LacI family DNA-binding transcriptional regulator [Agrobacterium vitis]